MQQTLRVGQLRCEHRSNPLGIDAPKPRLSWKLQAEGRARMQSAYQILAASSAESLTHDTGDLWDTGKVVSSQSNLVPYAGNLLKSHVACNWKVRVWDEHDQVSEWSEPALWTMGMLSSEDWQAKWIGFDGGEESRDVADDAAKARWLWLENPAAPITPEAPVFFRYSFDLPANRTVTRASVFASTDRRGTLYMNGHRVNGFQSKAFLFEMTVRHLLKPGVNTLAFSAVNLDEPERIEGLLVALRIEFADGRPLIVTTNNQWRASDVECDDWYAADFDDSHWPCAQDLGPSEVHEFGTPQKLDQRILPARMLRREFNASGTVKRATAYISGLGLSELYINGAKIGDHVLSPAGTEYNKRSLYVAHDVTEHIQSGLNAIGAWLGNGRFYAPRPYSIRKTGSYGYPKLCFHLRLEMDDGSVQELVSDESWKLTTNGPIRFNNEFDGEVYDARMEMPGWTEPNFDDSIWQSAQIVEKPSPALCAQMAEPIKVTEILHPKAMTQPLPGTYIFDMGQNMVGWCRLKVTGPRGTVVALRHAEQLQDDGTLYIDNLRTALQLDEYILKGDGVEVYEPRFTTHGFRYVELTGFPSTPELSTIEGCVVHDAVERAGTFECSNELLNRIYRNIIWGTRGNYRSFPMDCPQRDERQGWLGDRSEESRCETFFFNVAAFYTKWLCDIADTQKESGSIPDICPSYWSLYSDSLTWPSCLPIIPGVLYEQYGDRCPIERHYAAMKKWLDYMATFEENGIMPRNNYGDWCVPPEAPHIILSTDPTRNAPRDLVATAYYYYDLSLVATYAEMLGYHEEAQQHRGHAERVKTAFNEKYFNAEECNYANGTATAVLLPLAFGIVPEEARAWVFQRLVDKIMIDSDGHISTGLLGGQWLMCTLSKYGRADVAYTMASKTDYPSWGYMIERGATTIWELWNGDTAEPSMNSHNHVMLVGDLVTWMHSYLGGIRPAEPGYSKIILRPCLADGLDYVNVSWDSPHGTIASHWKRAGDRLTWDVTVPANTTATVHVPTTHPESVREVGGQQSGTADRNVRPPKYNGNHVVYEVGSGQYTFEARC